jgi:hypothetical protein
MTTPVGNVYHVTGDKMDGALAALKQATGDNTSSIARTASPETDPALLAKLNSPDLVPPCHVLVGLTTIP